MDDKNVIGIKKNPLEINVKEYESYILDKEFNLTVDYICDFLDIPENYVQRYIIKFLDRIEVTPEARRYLRIKDFKYSNLLNKKILISKKSFEKYLTNNLVKNQDRINLTYSVKQIEEEININEKEIRKKIRLLEIELNNKEKDIVYEYESLTNNLQSIEYMKIRLGLRHNTQIYRIIQKYNYKKYTLNKNTIRYSVDNNDLRKIIKENEDKIMYYTFQNQYLEEKVDNEDKDIISINIEQYTLDMLLKENQISKDIDVAEWFLAYIIKYLSKYVSPGGTK